MCKEITAADVGGGADAPSLQYLCRTQTLSMHTWAAKERTDKARLLTHMSTSRSLGELASSRLGGRLWTTRPQKEL